MWDYNTISRSSSRPADRGGHDPLERSQARSSGEGAVRHISSPLEQAAAWTMYLAAMKRWASGRPRSWLSTTPDADALAWTEGSCSGERSGTHRRLPVQPCARSLPRLIRSIYEAPEPLLSFPHRGRPGKKAGTRELVLSPLPWIVVYTVRYDVVHIVRILHGGQRRP